MTLFFVTLCISVYGVVDYWISHHVIGVIIRHIMSIVRREEERGGEARRGGEGRREN